MTTMPQRHRQMDRQTDGRTDFIEFRSISF